MNARGTGLQKVRIQQLAQQESLVLRGAPDVADRSNLRLRDRDRGLHMFCRSRLAMKILFCRS